MPVEYTFLVYALILFYVMIGWQVLQGMRAKGIASAFGPRDDWAGTAHVGKGRADRAVRNMTEALVLFAPLVVIAVETSQTSALTALAVKLFVVSRLAYALLYWLGVPYLRTLAWFGGVAALAILAYEVLT